MCMVDDMEDYLPSLKPMPELEVGRVRIVKCVWLMTWRIISPR